MTPKTRSPLKDKPLRNPGQSVEEQRADLAYDKVLSPLVVALGMCVLAGLEWWRHFHPLPPAPWLFTTLAVGSLGYCAFQFWRFRPRLRALRLASEGERAVGQFLERLRKSGYHVFHDILGDGFNVDHVLIGPAGIFTVETKTWNKPLGGQSRVICDRDSLRIGALQPDHNPLEQAKAQASWLREVLSTSTGKPYAVRAVVLFPGWYVEHTAGSKRDVWVLEPKALPQFLDREPVALENENIALASYHLSRFIRTEEKRRAAF